MNMIQNLVQNVFGASHQQNEAIAQSLKTGGLYSFTQRGKRGPFGIVKILVLEPKIVHVRVYNPCFSVRPTVVEDLDQGVESLLSDWTIGHLPLALNEFVKAWQPVLLVETRVEEEELEGYNIWKEDQGGVFS